MLHRLTLAVVLTVISGVVFAAKPSNITEDEMQLIPSYCPDTMGFNYGSATYNTSPRAGYWVSLMGKSFWAMHHYCWGLINLNRSQKVGLSSETRKANWEHIYNEYMYVVENSPPDFIMLPEIYTRIGDVQLMLKRPEKANEAFAHARKLKPDYWPAYSHWVEYLMHKNKRDDAFKLVVSGLEQSPDAKVLIEQYRLLGGKLSNLPKASPKKPADEVSEEMTAQHDSTQSSPSQEKQEELN